MGIKRRDFIVTTTASAGAFMASATPGATRSDEKKAPSTVRAPYKHIACEECYWPAEIFPLLQAYFATDPPDEVGMAHFFKAYWNLENPEIREIFSRLTDIGKGRVAQMDASGIDMQMLHVGPPGVQHFTDRSQAMEWSRLINERVAEAARTYPGRFFGLAAAPPQFPEQAATELEYAVHTLGLNGMIINSHTKSEYLDLPKFRPLWEALNALKVPLYIHPREPSRALIGAYAQYGIAGAAWGFAVEVSIHCLKLIMSGLFDDLPNLQIVIGHGGEGIPYFLDRLDNRFIRDHLGQQPKKLKRLPSEYFKEHFVVTTSGMNYHAPLKLCHEVLGPDRILFAVDYPFESNSEAVGLIDSAPLPPEDLRKICQLNAERVFKIKVKATT